MKNTAIEECHSPGPAIQELEELASAASWTLVIKLGNVVDKLTTLRGTGAASTLSSFFSPPPLLHYY